MIDPTTEMRAIIDAIAGDPDPSCVYDGGYVDTCKYCGGTIANPHTLPAGYVQIGVGDARGWPAPTCPYLRSLRVRDAGR